MKTQDRHERPVPGHRTPDSRSGRPAGEPERADPLEPMKELFRDLRTAPSGLSGREAARRLEVSGPNELVRRGGRRWPGEMARQFTHPLALLLATAAVLAWANGAPNLAIAIAAVIVLNAGFSLAQEFQAERAVEALAAFLPERARAVRDGFPQEIDARLLVPGDVLLIEEGDRICADARLMTGTVEVDMAALTGESVPVIRSAEAQDGHVPLLQAGELVFSGSECTGGEARAVVTATGMGTELGRIAALSQRVGGDESPLERQVKRVARLIALVAIGAGLAFLPIGLAAGLTLAAAVSFAIGLLVANVPEGLLPTITLALAVGVREMARRGALVKRLSAVETLGSTSVICTDKTGTLTQNSMHVTRIWTMSGETDLERPGPGPVSAEVALLAGIAAACNGADLSGSSGPAGDPTEVALLRFAAGCGLDVSAGHRAATRGQLFRFDPRIKLMTTVDRAGGSLMVNTKGAPEEVVARATMIRREAAEFPLTAADRAAVLQAMNGYARQGLRVLALARRELAPGSAVPARREDAEQDLCLAGLVAMLDPPRPEVPAAIARVHHAGIRVHVVTGDNGLTAAAIARRTGTDTLPALALSREPAEPGLMDRPPRSPKQGVISRAMLARAWAYLGLISATLVMAGFFVTLRHAGWHPGQATGPGTALNLGYRQATTVAWLGIVACQVGTAFAVRTEHASLRQVGVFTNKLLLAAIAIALAFAALLVYCPAMHGFFGTAALSPGQLVIVAPYPVIVWGADELRRMAVRRRRAGEVTNRTETGTFGSPPASRAA